MSVTILYGSDTGNAQDYAHYLAQKLRYYSIKPTISALDNYPMKHLISHTTHLIVLCSTAGQGELPPNGRKFFKSLLRKKLPADLFSHIKLTTFGLGDSSYPHFNHAIKKLHTRLMQLGCSELCPRCESDEMAPEGPDGYYAEWLNTLIPALQREFPTLAQIDDHTLLPPEYKIEIAADAADLQPPQDAGLARSGALIHGSIVRNQRITASDHLQDVRLLTLRADNKDLNYRPGDTVALYPPNDDRSVELMLESQPHWAAVADKPLHIHSFVDVDGGLVDPSSLTLRTLLKYHVDLSSIPRRAFFSLLFHFVDDSSEDGQREKEKLYEFTKLEEAEDLYDYANRPRRSILETVMEFSTNLRIPVEYVLDLFPLIKVRLFSIASRPDPETVDLVVGIVEYKTMLRRMRRGLCTKWIKTLAPGDKVVFSVHQSNLHFSTAHSENPPVVMIAPGTGIAPMKSLIEARAGQQDLYLFHGFRHSEKDALFHDLWDRLQNNGQLRLFSAISRQDGYPYKYVQDALFAQKELLSKLLVDEKAIVFLCGSSGKMPTQVRVTLVEILRTRVADPKQFLLAMENNGHFIQETW